MDKIKEIIKKYWKKILILYAMFFVIILTLFLSGLYFESTYVGLDNNSKLVERITYSNNYTNFMKEVKEKNVVSVKVGRDDLDMTLKNGKHVYMYHDGWLFYAGILKELSEAGVDVIMPDKPNEGIGFLSLMGIVISVLMPVLLFSLFVMFAIVYYKQFNSKSWVVGKEIKSDVKFVDVAGQEETKIELEEVKSFMKNPEIYKKVGARPPRGILMVGPPGTGKTLIAKALAGEVGANFMALSGSDFSAMFVGQGRNRVEKLFKEARKKAPSIIFIDEIDSVAKKRVGGSSDAGREYETTLNQLLVEMDGFKTEDEVIVIGATNRVDVLDPAAIRPGRFDRHVFIGLPDIKGRTEILKVHAKKIPLDKDVDLEIIAKGTPGFSGADLANIINEAAILSARKGVEIVSMVELEEAKSKVMMGLERTSMNLSEEEKKLIAVHESGHALVTCYLPHTDPVHKATIIPRGQSLGLVMRLPESDRFAIPREKLKSDLIVAMAGRAAEEIVFGYNMVTTGAASDIEQATDIATKMVTEWGMSEKIGMIKIKDNNENNELIVNEIKKLIDDSYQEAKKIIIENKLKFDILVSKLLEFETLDGEEVRKYSLN